MKKIILIISIFLLTIGLINADTINNYDSKLIGKILNGSDNDKIGWLENGNIGGGYQGPKTFTINPEGTRIYIPDLRKDRIAIYDINLNFVGSIIEKDNNLSHYARVIKIDEQGNIISLLGSKGLSKMDLNGNTIFKIERRFLPTEVTSRKNFFIQNNKIFFYNNEQEIGCISEKGEILSKEKAIKYLTGLTTDYSDIPAKKRNMYTKVIDKMKKDGKGIIFNDEYYNSVFRNTKKYFQQLTKKEYKEIEANKTVTVKRNDKTEELPVKLNLDNYDIYCIDYDNENNSYWQISEKKDTKGVQNYGIMILSKYGDLLDAFYYGQQYLNSLTPYKTDIYPTSGAKIAIAPNGNIYFMKGDKKSHQFWKVDRQW